MPPAFRFVSTQGDEVAHAMQVPTVRYPVAALCYQAITATVCVDFAAMRAGQFENPSVAPATRRCGNGGSDKMRL